MIVINSLCLYRDTNSSEYDIRFYPEFKAPVSIKLKPTYTSTQIKPVF